MFTNVILIVIGFVLLIKGADFLVDGSSAIAKKFHIPDIIIGLTLVSIGTSMPELFVSSTSALDGMSDLAVGNVVGSNLCNLLLILGVSAAINPIKFKPETKKIEIPLCVGITILFLVLANIDNDISTLDSIILLVCFVGFIIYTIYVGKKAMDEEKNSKKGSRIKIIPNICYIVLGIVALKYGGDLVVNHASALAKYFHISEKVIGLTIVAIGTSLPELVTNINASIKGNSDIAIGNIIGSNIFNLLLITGVSGVINPIHYNATYNVQLVILIVATIVLAIFPYTDKKDEMTMSNGITYLMMYALYIGLLLFT